MTFTRFIRHTSVVIALIVATAACASVNVNDLPQPGNAHRDGYDIVMEFENVLNLPDRAKVLLDGREVGFITDVSIEQDRVDVTARLGDLVSAPADVHAALQQATVLGDTYIVLRRSDAADGVPADPLTDGSRIPIAQTISPPQLEDTIATLANFVASGSIQRVQNSIISLNRVTPTEDGAVRGIATRFTANLRDLSDNLDDVDALLNNAQVTAAVTNEKTPSFASWFSPEGMQRWMRAFRVIGFAGKLIPTVGSIYSGGYWLIPLFTAMADATGAIQRAKWDFEDEVPAWRQLFTDYFLPQDKYPAINITSITGPDGRELSGDVHNVLRILGAVP
ncbi:MCE family protein [Mycolicibacterium neoaurum]|uniref:MlaD family protein n=1 Tax=Mycolicibacterium neoaurum TaxID=1795 RepID=UPI001BCE1DC8|nr:MlaD family protein [Mycolicibacterium neoaurum]QVI27220.1 MCE family protein [Mycolicibacterium neoaurum]